MSYPLSAFHFRVDRGGNEIGFKEVSGLEAEVGIIEYHDGANLEYSPRKIPGLVKYGNITFKRGITQNDNKFIQWFNSTKLNQTERRDITISLLNDNH